LLLRPLIAYRTSVVDGSFGKYTSVDPKIEPPNKPR
jgi:hypothetical protein